MNFNVLFLPLFLFLFLASIFIIQLMRHTQGEAPDLLESALLGKTVPTFKLEDLEKKGRIYESTVLHNGTPTLLNIWATWCPTCQGEHGYLNKLAAQGIRIIGLNYKDNRMKAVEWLNRLGNPYVLSLYDADGMLGMDLGVYGAPETFLIDGQGVIRYRHAGDLNDRVWQQHMLPIYQKYQDGK